MTAPRYAQVLKPLTISDANPHYTDIMSLDQCSIVGVQVKWSAGAAPVGAVKQQATNDVDPTSATWTDLTPAGAISGNSGSLIVRDFPAIYRWVRWAITLTSGDATFEANAKAQE